MNESLNQWYKFLNEQEEKKYKIAPRKLESIFKVFHLSSRLLGNSEEKGSFEFTPRVPRHAATGEDNFTKRISLAPKINRAVYGITMEPKKYHPHMSAVYYVYAGDFKSDPTDDIPTAKMSIELRRCNKDLSYKHPETGENRKYSEWESWTIGSFVDAYKIKKYGTKHCKMISSTEKSLECQRLTDAPLWKAPDSFAQYSNELKQKFYACVPDAYKSREEWSLEPVDLYYIGIYLPQQDKVLITQKVFDWIKTKNN